ncbi:hypothetical protein Cni_G25502 [Canna indica]|uniref:Coenzyme Q-binding protein COQ10 START domain-containing protein n=1 Tax=Canna indica TaxID=4628 RepID=A0AAQ3KXS4_9LILI|nr:hypothetical protein Cni_G25502 [Canna indica]
MVGVVAVDRAFCSPLLLRPPPTSFFSSFSSTSYPFNSSSSSAHGKALSCDRPTRHSLLANPTSIPPRGCLDNDDVDEVLEIDSASVHGEGEESFEIEVQKVGDQMNRRRIRSRIRVDAELETVWSVLTNYEGLADFIPSLAVSRLLDKKDNVARLYQVGEQNLALGLKFNAKGILDCYERDMELLPGGRRRDIDFKMVEGDFDTFEGKWSIEQIVYDANKDEKNSVGEDFQTTLSYIVELVPKLWLPVQLIEGRLCSEVKTNLLCVQEEAQRVQRLKDKLLDIGESRDDETEGG